MKHSELHRVWMNNNSGELFIAVPWWDTVDPEDIDFEIGQHLGLNCINIGTFYQVGWLIQNKNGIWFGMNYDITGNGKDFEDLGSIY